ncbi:MAG TPA: carboxypeptidase regulatory-like domain-containing protein [Vicinamibacterales bacterium]|nr:carboxypeptidase regulatory-like domain-containing protein [Vicinamibacterales bacterium]
MPTLSAARIRRAAVGVMAGVCLVAPRIGAAQGLTGTLIGTVRDDQGAVLRGVDVHIQSAALIGGPARQTSDDRGQFRFLALAPGRYTLDVDRSGFARVHEDDIQIGAGATIERTVTLKIAGLADSIVVEGTGSRIDVRDVGVRTRFGPEDIKAIPTRRASMFDFIRAAPGISPTSPSSATTTTVSAFGSGTNENQFLIDGTNTTCPCNGVARSELGVDFIQEVHVQSAGASAEFGSVQGAVINVITRQGSARYQYDASYYGQPAALASQPVVLPLDPVQPSRGQSGYERDRYRDFTTSLGGPVVRDRLWFFGGYQHLRDYDSQPGTDRSFPRTYEQDKIFGKLTWRLTPRLQLMQSFHDEFWVNPDPPTLTTRYDATRRRTASVPAMTLAHLTHAVSANTLWDARLGRFNYWEDRTPSTGDWTIPSRSDRVTGVTSGAPPIVGDFNLVRTTAKATITHYRAGWLRAGHELKAGAQFERGAHHGANIIPTGTRYVDNDGRPFQAIASEPSNTGGLFDSAAVFVSDSASLGARFTISAGLRFERIRAVSQDLPVLDSEGRDTTQTVRGLGTMYTWNVWSPRLGATAKLTADGRTILRATYGRFNSGVFTGELSPFHPGVTPSVTHAFDTATGGYTRFVRSVDPRVNLLLDDRLRPPHTGEYAIGIDREIGRRVAAAVAYIHKDGDDFIGWTEVGGQYRQEVRTLPDGRLLPVWVLAGPTSALRYLLTNPAGYSQSYNGIVTAIEMRRSHGWQAFASYTYSRTSGLLASSGETASGAQASTIATPTRTFGRDPNDLTNAYGRLPNDRPHVLRVMGAIDLPRTGLVVAANLQHFTGKPWAATTQIDLPQGDQRVQLESRGTRRLEAQTLLDLRVSRSIACGRLGRIELLADILNTLNDTAAESIATDNLFSPTFAQPSLLMDPRRVMLGVRLNVGR